MKIKFLIFTLPQSLKVQKERTLCPHCHKPCYEWQRDEQVFCFLRVEIQGSEYGLKKDIKEIKWLIRYIDGENGLVEFSVSNPSLGEAIKQMQEIIATEPRIIKDSLNYL